MTTLKRAFLHCGIALLASAGFFSCDEDIVRENAPVQLVANVLDVKSRIDFADAECGFAVKYELRNIPKRSSFPGGVTPNIRFLDVLLRTKRTTFVRVDGGTVVPRPFLENISVLIPASGSAVEIPTPAIFPGEYLNEAPFAALQAAAGGRDPETGQTFIRMDLITEFFGETLAGDPVSTSMRYPLTFCFNCGGCFPKD